MKNILSLINNLNAQFEMKISLIIPVYNVEKYIEQCLQSCISQNISAEDYEIILINDGTKDNSLNIAEQIAKRHSNIKIISQHNQGLSVARNNGLKIAKGNYVWFIDSDDWIEQDCLADITNLLFKYNLDALTITASNVKNEKIEQRMDWSNINNQIFTGKDFALNIGYHVCAPFTIYKRDYLINNNIFFMPSIFHEDSEFTPRAYYNLNKVSVFSHQTYYVRQNPHSITRTINPKKSFDLLKVALSLSKFSKKTDKNYAKKISRNIVTCINSSLLGAKHFSKEQKKVFKDELHKNKDLFYHYFANPSILFYVEGILFSLFPRKSIFLYHLFNNLLRKHI